MQDYSSNDNTEIRLLHDRCKAMIAYLSDIAAHRNSSPAEMMRSVRLYINYWKYAVNARDKLCMAELEQYQAKYRAFFPSVVKSQLSAKDRRLLYFLYLSPRLVCRIATVLTWIHHIPSHIRLFQAYCSGAACYLGLSGRDYAIEYKKYRTSIKNDSFLETLWPQINEFFGRNIDCLSNRAVFSKECTTPTVVCVVKNEAARMRLFYHYYRKLGVTQFAILDNGSTDGTLEFLLQQPDTHVYSVTEPFETQKKTAWIEKLLAMEGYDRWYIVVDSDELLDYPGSEELNITQFITRLAQGGYERAWGFMLDMYSDKDLFCVDCDALQIPEELCLFDSDSYILRKYPADLFPKMTAAIIGGPRYRLFGAAMLQSKQSVFYYTSDTLYRNCHFLCPTISWEDAPCCFVLKHYKFLKSDAEKYQKRAEEKNFYNGSAEYIQQMEAIDKGACSMIYEKSVHYDNSHSLHKLPFLTDIFHQA